MSAPGEVRYVNMDGEFSWTTYVRDQDGMWLPVDHSGPGYMTDNQIEKKEWHS